MKTVIPCPMTEPVIPTEPLSFFVHAPPKWMNRENNHFFFSTGEGAIDPNDPNKANTLSQLSKTEISLFLTSKYDLGDGEAIDGQSLMIK